MARYIIIVQYFHKDSKKYVLENTSTQFAETRLTNEIRKAKKANSGVAFVIMNSVVRWQARGK